MNNELSAGTAISHYRIVSKIGAGGMGEVYRARDTRLEREVAIKLLPAEVSTDADRLQRFEQEARATSALNHPNILTVYDIGTHEGSPYIVAELLEGEELRAPGGCEQTEEPGPVPLGVAVEQPGIEDQECPERDDVEQDEDRLEVEDVKRPLDRFARPLRGGSR